MGRRTTRGHRPPPPARPSWFFLIALFIGVLLLVWLAASAINKPVRPKLEPARSTTGTTS